LPPGRGCLLDGAGNGGAAAGSRLVLMVPAMKAQPRRRDTRTGRDRRRRGVAAWGCQTSCPAGVGKSEVFSDDMLQKRLEEMSVLGASQGETKRTGDRDGRPAWRSSTPGEADGVVLLAETRAAQPLRVPPFFVMRNLEAGSQHEQRAEGRSLTQRRWGRVAASAVLCRPEARLGPAGRACGVSNQAE
jgi:hypothetical protein